MVVKTIVPPAPDIANVRADEYDKLAGYETFRRIKDDFEEPARPSIDDVESVAAILRDTLASTFSQDSAEFVDSEPLTGEWAERNGLLDSSQIAHGTKEGRTHQLILSPGGIRLTTFDARARAATEERALQNQKKRDGSLARFCAVAECPLFELLPDGGSGAEIKAWSAKSRVRLMETVSGLDYSCWTRESGTLAMVTLTLPGDWEVLVPSGADFKKLVEKFRRRWVRATGTPWVCLWKLEFQGRGAPHWHGLLRVPVFVKGRIFTEWLSETWADVVGASQEIDGLDKWGQETSEYIRHLRAGTGVDFSGKDFSDPRRISMYFLGHSAKSTDGKEYQHDVPKIWQQPGKGPGRFWGNPGLSKAVAAVNVTEADMQRLKRIVRKVKRARDWKMNVLREQGAAKREGLVPPRSVDVGYPKPKYSIGITAHRTRNRRALALHQLGYSDVLPAAHFPFLVEGPVFRVSNLVSVPPAVGIGPSNLVVRSWAPQARSYYAPFSGGKGGFVLVNDGLQLGLDIARAAGPAALSLADRLRACGTDKQARKDLVCSVLP